VANVGGLTNGAQSSLDVVSGRRYKWARRLAPRSDLSWSKSISAFRRRSMKLNTYRYVRAHLESIDQDISDADAFLIDHDSVAIEAWRADLVEHQASFVKFILTRYSQQAEVPPRGSGNR
jgi:hypothetical protein